MDEVRGIPGARPPHTGLRPGWRMASVGAGTLSSSSRHSHLGDHWPGDRASANVFLSSEEEVWKAEEEQDEKTIVHHVIL